jgi:hypothetical protein
LNARLEEHTRPSKHPNSKKAQWIKSLAEKGLKPKINLLKDNCHLGEALKLEESLIKKHKNIVLNNQTRGSLNSFVTPSNRRSVIKYSISGEVIATYDSVSQAIHEHGIDKRAIYRCLSGKRKTFGGFIWKYSEKRKLSHKTICTGTKKLVCQYDEDKCIAIYKSAKEASNQTKINEQEIIKCCRNKKKTAGKYTWQYVDTL